LFQGEKYTRIVNENSVASTSTGDSVTLKHEASDSQVVESREIAGIHFHGSLSNVHFYFAQNSEK
jgi:hypothetical protein